MRRIVLVYQCGIANVFEVDRLSTQPDGRNARRLYQHAFGPCEDFARGCAAMGAVVRTAHCAECGDISQRPWSADLGDAPFSDKFRPVRSGSTRAAVT